jgi:hypothetical protein
MKLFDLGLVLVQVSRKVMGLHEWRSNVCQGVPNLAGMHYTYVEGVISLSIYADMINTNCCTSFNLQYDQGNKNFPHFLIFSGVYRVSKVSFILI